MSEDNILNANETQISIIRTHTISPIIIESLNKIESSNASPIIKAKVLSIKKFSDIPPLKLTPTNICYCKKPETHKNIDTNCAANCGEPECFDKMSELPNCQHKMHDKCIDKLLFTRLSCCPICRSSVNTWRTSKHYAVIDREINNTFEDDTERAIRQSILAAQQANNDNNNNNNNDDNNNNNESDPNTRPNTRENSQIVERNQSRSRSRSR